MIKLYKTKSTFENFAKRVKCVNENVKVAAQEFRFFSTILENLTKSSSRLTSGWTNSSTKALIQNDKGLLHEFDQSKARDFQN